MNTSNESIQNLKPCPFCGGKADFDYDDSGYNWVFCTKCGVTTDTDMHDEFDARLRLAKAWNTRADGWISVNNDPMCNGLDSIPVDVFTSDQGRVTGCTYLAGIGCYWHLLGEIENVTHYMYQPSSPSNAQ
ncbi:Lar family restriction alleviation protein [Shewanella sp.]|uniref:Lar family restriction alleviation protein n=1 Tax=Shewanella sp. TaxID=50422 RepID=UPI001B68D7D7|nr:Lar family restriction alleviation protein [Shewanella sp.]MBP6517893.1 Lar family restriction alleviation protein [Shewanella sp.]